jgi:hemolysin D
MFNTMAKQGDGAPDFSPAVLRMRNEEPGVLSGVVLRTLLLLLALMLAWAAWGRLDIVAVAQGKIVPASFLKIVQPAEQGIVREILVSEGELVREGQVLIRMDASLSEADRSVVENEFMLRDLQLRRIDAELSGTPMKRQPGDKPQLFAQVEAQHGARRQAHEDRLAEERTLLARAQQDIRVAQEVEAKLRKTLPIYREQAEGWDKLAREGFAGRLMAMERQRLYIENEQDLRAQGHTIASLEAAIVQSQRRIAQLSSGYRQQLQSERVEAAAQHHRLLQDLNKQRYRASLLELKAPQAGIIKDLATRTPGTVVAPGTILLTLVPQGEPLVAEAWISNADAGFVRVDQKARIKVAAYPFQKYGMIEGAVRQIGADAQEKTENSGIARSSQEPAYRALLSLEGSHPEDRDKRQALVPGMLITAEIHLGTRSVWEYLLSPLQRVGHEAGRER